MRDFTVLLPPSKRVFAFVLGEHFLALLSLWPLSFALWLKGLVSLLILFSFGVTLYRVVLKKHPQSVVAFGQTANENWWLKMRSGLVMPALLSDDLLVTSFLLSLHFKLEGQRQRRFIFLCPFMTSANHYRQVLMAVKKSQ